MRLYVEGHAPNIGYAVSRKWSESECKVMPEAAAGDAFPLRIFSTPARAQRFVAIWNRLFATH